MDKRREDFEKLFNEFAAKHDTLEDEWLDMGAGDYFIAGCIAALDSRVVELPEEVIGSYERNKAIGEFKLNLEDAGIKYK